MHTQAWSRLPSCIYGYRCSTSERPNRVFRHKTASKSTPSLTHYNAEVTNSVKLGQKAVQCTQTCSKPHAACEVQLRRPKQCSATNWKNKPARFGLDCCLATACKTVQPGLAGSGSFPRAQHGDVATQEVWETGTERRKGEGKIASTGFLPIFSASYNPPVILKEG